MKESTFGVLFGGASVASVAFLGVSAVANLAAAAGNPSAAALIASGVTCILLAAAIGGTAGAVLMPGLRALGGAGDWVESGAARAREGRDRALVPRDVPLEGGLVREAREVPDFFEGAHAVADARPSPLGRRFVALATVGVGAGVVGLLGNGLVAAGLMPTTSSEPLGPDWEFTAVALPSGSASAELVAVPMPPLSVPDAPPRTTANPAGAAAFRSAAQKMGTKVQGSLPIFDEWPGEPRCMGIAQRAREVRELARVDVASVDRGLKQGDSSEADRALRDLMVLRDRAVFLAGQASALECSGRTDDRRRER